MKSVWISAAAGVMIGLGSAASAQAADAASGEQARATPKNWNYQIKDGKRVPKGNRVVRADGSWREEIRVGKCVTIKEKSSVGEYKESRRCD